VKTHSQQGKKGQMKKADTLIKKFLQGHSLASLPPEVVHEAKRAVLDAMGCMIAGLDTPLSGGLLKLCAGFASPGGASLIGCPHKVIPMMAAMCHGFMANAHDADDGHRRSRLHTGGVVIPAALALAGQTACSGKKLLEAVVLGFEFAHRAGVIANCGPTYHGSAHGGAYGAAAAAGWLLGLSETGIINAMGICEMQAPICDLMGWIEARQAPMIKEGMGWSAASGVMAALMAQAGITGSLTLFNQDGPSKEALTLGGRYETMQRYYKPHPGCRWSHGAVQIMRELMSRHGLKPEQAGSIKVRILERAANLDQPHPATMEDAQYSIPFILGATLVEGVFGPEQMSPQKLKDPQILSIAHKVRIQAEPAFEAEYPLKLVCELEVTTTDGRSFKGRNELMHGDPLDPLSDQELMEKFNWLGSKRLSPADASALAGSIWQLEAQDSVAAWFARIVEATATPRP
jgi:2-methylcitrate dehydratase PrpD